MKRERVERMEAGTMRRRKRTRVGAEEGRKSLRGKGRREKLGEEEEKEEKEGDRVG